MAALAPEDYLDDDEFFYMLSQSAVEPYLYEPEYTEEEMELRDMQMREAEAVSAAATAAAEHRPRRAGSNDHCLCGRCPAMPSEPESLCCREWARAQFIFDELDQNAVTEEEGSGVCMTTHTSFHSHLDRHVLGTYFRIPKINWKKQPKPAGANGTMTDEQYRLAGYRITLEWALQGERLGKGYRIPLPACVVKQVRQKYPSPDGVYTGFVGAEDLFRGL